MICDDITIFFLFSFHLYTFSYFVFRASKSVKSLSLMLMNKALKVIRCDDECIGWYDKGSFSKDFGNHFSFLIIFIHVSSYREEAKEQQKRMRNRKIKRYALVGLATLGGGAVLGLTGGLAAPLIGAGMASVFGGAAAVIGSTTGKTRKF